MGTSDLIRLAEELARCGGVHRLTNLVTAAIHVLREHDQRRTVEAWEDGPDVGVGMSDKVVTAPKSVECILGYCVHSGHQCDFAGRCAAPSRAPEREGECGGPAVGVGMSDKAARDLTLEIHDDAQRALRDRPPRYRPQAPSRAPGREEAFGRCVQNAENVEESTTSCYNRPVEVVEHPDGSDHRQEGPRQWLKEPYPSGDTISSGLPICTSMPSPMGRMSASTAETQPTPSITFALSGTSRDCSTISPIMPTGFDMGSLPSLVAETATADSAGSSPTASAKSAKSLSDGCDASTSISSANTIGSQRNLPNLDTVSEATSRDRKPSETGSCPGSTSPGHGKPGCCEPATEHSAPEGRGALAGTPDGLREVKLEPGWLGEQFKAAQEVLDALPPSLREQTPARRNARAMDKCDEHDFRRSNPAPLTSINGERKPLPQSDCQDEHPHTISEVRRARAHFASRPMLFERLTEQQIDAATRPDDPEHCGGPDGKELEPPTRPVSEPMNPSEPLKHSGSAAEGQARGGIIHEPGSPLLKAQDDFGRRERLVPKFDGKRINPEDDGA